MGSGRRETFRIFYLEGRVMKWEWEKSSGLIKEDGEDIAAVFGASASSMYNPERAYRNARLIENAPELHRLLEGIASGDDIAESEIIAVLERINGNELDMPELKSCPFCGGEAEVYEDEEWFYVLGADRRK